MQSRLSCAIRDVISREISAKGIKQVHVARQVGMRVDSFNAFMRGHRKLKSDELIAVSSFLGIPLKRYHDALEDVADDSNKTA